VREDEKTGKIFSYSTDQFSYDQNSGDFDFDLNSEGPKILREDEETKKIFSYNEGAFKNTEARMIYDGTVRETYEDETVIRRSRP